MNNYSVGGKLYFVLDDKDEQHLKSMKESIAQIKMKSWDENATTITYEHLLELLFHCDQINFKTNRFHFHYGQIAYTLQSIIISIQDFKFRTANPKATTQQRGALFNIRTGKGKTVALTTTASILTILGRVVDIVSSHLFLHVVMLIHKANIYPNWVYLVVAIHHQLQHMSHVMIIVKILFMVILIITNGMICITSFMVKRQNCQQIRNI
jgi:hypothetical protein